MIIYKITNKITGKFYIGQTIRSLHKRIKSYQYEVTNYINNKNKIKRPIIYTIAKYGLENFQFIKIDKAKTQKELDAKEQFWISIYSSYIRGIGYNLDRSRGGTGIRSLSTRKRISQSLMGNKNPFYGKHHSHETIQQMIISHTGKIISNNQRLIMSNILSGDKSPNSRLTNNEANLLRKERKYGASLKVLSEKYKISKASVSRICNNLTY